MHRLVSLVAWIGCAAAAAAPSSSGPFYVSPLGNDEWSGTLPNPSGSDGPFLTPGRAAEAVVAIQRPLLGDIRVWLRAGVYPLTLPLNLSGPLSGGDGPDAVVRWGKFPADAADAVLSGGVPVTGWTQTTPGIWRASLPASAPQRCRELLVAGRRAWPARVPAIAGPTRDDTFSDASTLHFTSSLSGCGFNPPVCWPKSQCPSGDAWGFVYNASDSRGPSPAWRDIPGIDVVVFGAWTASWAPVAAIVGANNSLLTASPLSAAVPGDWGGEGCPSGARYALYNVFEALAASSGTFYVNDSEAAVYYAPLPGEDIASLEVIVPVLTTAVIVGSSGAPVAWLELAGLNVTGGTDAGLRYAGGYSQRGLVEVTNASNVALSNCTASLGDAAGIMLLSGLTNVSVLGCGARDLGGDGIGCIPWVGDDALDTTIADCVIEGVGLVFLDQPTGLRVTGSAAGTVTVTHNLIRDTPYAGIMAGWHAGVKQTSPTMPWRYVITQNLVEDCGRHILSDFAGIYVSSSGTGCEADASCFIPTLVQGNLVRNIRGYNYGGNGVYTDENVAGVYFVGNALTNTSGDAVYLHCGLNQTVTNNILYDGHANDVAGGGFSTGLLGSCNTGGVPSQFTNISALITLNVWLVVGSGSTLFQGDMYPSANMTFEENTYWAAPPLAASALRWPPQNSLTFSQWQGDGEDAGSVVADPLIADAPGGNFTLLPGSPALARGFQQLELGGIGPRTPSRG